MLQRVDQRVPKQREYGPPRKRSRALIGVENLYSTKACN